VAHARVFIPRAAPRFSSLIGCSDNVVNVIASSLDFSESLLISITIFVIIWIAFLVLYILFVQIEIIIYIFIGIGDIIVVIKF